MRLLKLMTSPAWSFRRAPSVAEKAARLFRAESRGMGRPPSAAMLARCVRQAAQASPLRRVA